MNCLNYILKEIFKSNLAPQRLVKYYRFALALKKYFPSPLLKMEVTDFGISAIYILRISKWRDITNHHNSLLQSLQV